MTNSNLSSMIVNLENEEIADVVQKRLDEGLDPQIILGELMDGMKEVGRLYEQNEYFLPELVLAGETMKEAFQVLKPHLQVDGAQGSLTVIAATVKGDNHDIGKNILITMLLSAGFDVVDLGTDCPADRIVNAVQKHSPRIIALSALLTTTMNEIRRVHEALIEAGLRESVKMIVGGVPLSQEIAIELGADAYGHDAIDGVKQIKALVEK